MNGIAIPYANQVANAQLAFGPKQDIEETPDPEGDFQLTWWSKFHLYAGWSIQVDCIPGQAGQFPQGHT
jgi:hypothetical protein